MHMSDAMLSPPVGAVMWAAAGAVLAGSARKMGREIDSARVPLMGVLAAFVFAGQLINFTIPGTGSSGHLGGGMILAALLGPPAAFIAMASILTVQALFFADGGLLALGCNMINLGFFPAFVAYPLLFRPLLGREPSARRMTVASLAAAVIGLQLGALGVVLETVASGIADLPLASFAALVLPLHLAIGLVEGLITAAVVSFVWQARPEILFRPAAEEAAEGRGTGRAVAVLAAATLVAGSAFAWFASTNPDGLEWSVGKVAGVEELETPAGKVHAALEDLQEKTAVLPDYGYRAARSEEAEKNGADGEAWPAVSAGTSLSGIVGGLLTLLLTVGLAMIFRRRKDGGAAGSGS